MTWPSCQFVHAFDASTRGKTTHVYCGEKDAVINAMMKGNLSSLSFSLCLRVNQNNERTRGSLPGLLVTCKRLVNTHYVSISTISSQKLKGISLTVVTLCLCSSKPRVNTPVMVPTLRLHDRIEISAFITKFNFSQC